MRRDWAMPPFTLTDKGIQMKNKWTKMREDLENEIEKAIRTNRAERANSGTTSGRKKTRSVLCHIIFWLMIVSGAIALYELLHK